MFAKVVMVAKRLQLRLCLVILVVLYCAVGQAKHDECSQDEGETLGLSGRRLQACIEQLKRQAADSKLYWFGERWRRQCGQRRKKQPSCYNPPKLAGYKSVGSRILRVPTFDMGYLHHLRIFPSIEFTSSPGVYTGCDHEHRFDTVRTLRGSGADGAPIASWHSRQPPRIWWPQLKDQQDRHILLLIDVAYGQLHYLASDFPAESKVLQNYKELSNYRHTNSPFALLVFEQPADGRQLLWEAFVDDDGAFNVQQFMIANALQQKLIGLNWINVAMDAYSIEKTRIHGVVDNCAALLKEKLYAPIENLKFGFLPSSSFTDLDSWVSVTYKTLPIRVSFCCDVVTINNAYLRADPLKDDVVDAAMLRSPPTLAVLQLQRPNLYDYRRSGRDYLALIDDSLYTVMLLDTTERTKTPRLHWLIANIPGVLLTDFGEGAGGDRLFRYRQPLPFTVVTSRYVLLLFQQLHGRIRPAEPMNATCDNEYEGCPFPLKRFMGRHQLRLRALNWVQSHRSAYVDYVLVAQHGHRTDAFCRHADVGVCPFMAAEQRPLTAGGDAPHSRTAALAALGALLLVGIWRTGVVL